MCYLYNIYIKVILQVIGNCAWLMTYLLFYESEYCLIGTLR